MFPGMGGVGGRGMNPAKMKQMMKQMGIDVKELKDVEEVIIKTADSNIIIENRQRHYNDSPGFGNISDCRRCKRSPKISGNSLLKTSNS